MSLNNREVDAIVQVAASFISKLQAATAIADTGGDVPVLADFPGAGHGAYTTTATISALINRYFAEQHSDSKGPPHQKRPAIATS